MGQWPVDVSSKWNPYLILILSFGVASKILFSGFDVMAASRATENTVLRDRDGLDLVDAFVAV